MCYSDLAYHKQFLEQQLDVITAAFSRYNQQYTDAKIIAITWLSVFL